MSRIVYTDVRLTCHLYVTSMSPLARRNWTDRPPIESARRNDKHEAGEPRREGMLLEKLRRGKTGMIGRGLAFAAAFGPIPQLLRGITLSRADLRPSAHASATLTTEELKELTAHAPDVLQVSADDIWIGWGGGKTELARPGAVEQEVVITEQVNTATEVHFDWGGREFKKAELRTAEEERLAAELRPRIEQLLAPYREFGIDQEAIRRITVEGDVFSSPEGHAQPAANQALSERRAELLTQIVREVIRDLGIPEARAEVAIRGRGAQGDVLEFGSALAKLGYRFTSPAVDAVHRDPLEARRQEVEGIIRRMHDGDLRGVAGHLPRDARNIDALLELYLKTIANKRVGNLNITIDTKPVHLGVSKEMPKKKTILGEVKEMAKPEVMEGIIVPSPEEKRRQQAYETAYRFRSGKKRVPYRRVQSSAQRSGMPFFRVI